MADVKKYLDAEGLAHLWGQISLQDYPNNETLIAVINAIDTTKKNKDIIVTKGDDGLATMSSTEIAAAMAEGTTVYFREYSTDSLQEFLEGGATGVVFHSNFISDSSLQGQIFLIDPDKNITKYSYTNTAAAQALTDANTYTDTQMSHLVTEEWTFTLEDGSTVTKQVVTYV